MSSKWTHFPVNFPNIVPVSESSIFQLSEDNPFMIADKGVHSYEQDNIESRLKVFLLFLEWPWNGIQHSLMFFSKTLTSISSSLSSWLTASRIGARLNSQIRLTSLFQGDDAILSLEMEHSTVRTFSRIV